MSKGKKVLLLLGLFLLGYFIYKRPERAGDMFVALGGGIAHMYKSITIVFDIILKHLPAKR